VAPCVMTQESISDVTHADVINETTPRASPYRALLQRSQSCGDLSFHPTTHARLTQSNPLTPNESPTFQRLEGSIRIVLPSPPIQDGITPSRVQPTSPPLNLGRALYPHTTDISFDLRREMLPSPPSPYHYPPSPSPPSPSTDSDICLFSSMESQEVDMKYAEPMEWELGGRGGSKVAAILRMYDKIMLGDEEGRCDCHGACGCFSAADVDM